MDLFDMIGPVMIGPSSSHTAGAARIGLMARTLLGEDVQAAEIGFHGSFARTYKGHGTDRAVAGGLMGMQVDDPRLRDSLELARAAGISLHFAPVSIRGAHPNTVRLDVVGARGGKLHMEAASVGGGLISIRKLDGMRVEFSGKENTLIIHHRDEPGMIAAVTGRIAAGGMNIATMQVFRQQAHEEAMMVLEMDEAVPEEVLLSLTSLPNVSSVAFIRERES